MLLLAAAVAVAFAAGHGGAGAREQSERRPPVVLVVFDEFPADTLIGPDGRIDAARYPNFAALAGTSTWFRNAETVYDSTFKAVPAILDARMPRAGTAPDVRSHQPSVFHLMNKLGYGVIKVESGTALCPPWICPGWAHSPTRRAQAAGRRRAAGPAAQVDRRDPRPLAADLLLPARAAAARAVDLPALGTPEPPRRQRPDRGHQPRRRLRRPAPDGPQPPASPAPGRLHRPPARADHAADAAHGDLRPRAVRRRRRPRHRVRGRRQGAQAGQRDELRAGRGRPVLRQGAGPDRGARGRPRGEQPRRRPDGGGPAAHAGLVEARRALGLLALRSGRARRCR